MILSLGIIDAAEAIFSLVVASAAVKGLGQAITSIMSDKITRKPLLDVLNKSSAMMVVNALNIEKMSSEDLEKTLSLINSEIDKKKNAGE